MEKAGELTAMSVTPNRSVGPLVLGASLHEILAHIKSQPSAFPSFEIYYDRNQPITEPITINLPRNGLRARFDGKEQRLRLVEVYDFSRLRFTYKDTEIGKAFEPAALSMGLPPKSNGPTFRHVYDKLLGPTFGGEYTPPSQPTGSNDNGTYVLSYPGIAFSFPVRHSAYSPTKEFIPLLSSSATSAATSMVVYHGEDWPTVRQTLFSNPLVSNRVQSATVKSKEESPEDIEFAKVLGAGRVELVRRSGLATEITLGETTPQDLITELGAPDAIHWKSDRRLSIHKERTSSQASGRSVGVLGSGRNPLLDSTHSSALQSDDDDSSDWEDDIDTLDAHNGEATSEHFYNYFTYGFDVLITESSHRSPSLPRTASDGGSESPIPDDDTIPTAQLTATKIILHGNVPGSYQFNRHRRLRWSLDQVPVPRNEEPVSSETQFTKTSERLKQLFRGSYTNSDEEVLMQRGMAINRGWGDSPGSSCELLGGFEESSSTGRRKIQNDGTSSVMEGSEGTGVGRTMLYGFPGMIFEVMENDTVCTLSIY